MNCVDKDIIGVNKCYDAEALVLNIKSLPSKGIVLLCFIFVLFAQFNQSNGQFISTLSHENHVDDWNYSCRIDDQFTFGLSLVYAGASIITLIVVSYWSFKRMHMHVTGLKCQY